MRLLGIAVMLIAAAFGIAAMMAGGELRSAAERRADGLDQTLAASATALRAADDTVAIVVSSIDQISSGLVAVEDAALESIRTIDDAENAVGKLADISGEDVPRIVEALQEAMPALIQVADVIDGTLGALSIVGVPYDPEVPFDESLTRVAGSIEDLPDQMRAQAVAIGEVAGGLGRIADQGGELIVEIGVARVRLNEGLQLLRSYRETTESAIAAVEAERSALEGSVVDEQTAISWLTAALVAAQIAVFTVGAVLAVRPAARH